MSKLTESVREGAQALFEKGRATCRSAFASARMRSGSGKVDRRIETRITGMRQRKK